MLRYLLLGLVCVLLAGCSNNKAPKQTVWGTYQEPYKAQTLPADSGAEEIRILWKKDIGSGAANGFAQLIPAYTEHGLSVANRGGEIFMFDLQSGAAIWKQKLPFPVNSAVGESSGIIAVGHDQGEVTALNAEDGQVLWTVSIKRQISAVPAVGIGRVVIRTSDGLVIGLDSQNGNVVWQFDYEISGLVIRGDSAPTISGNSMLVGLSNGKLVANNVITGRNFWETDISLSTGQNEIERIKDADTPPIIQGTLVYSASYQGNVMALQLENAEAVWKTNLSTRMPMSLDQGVLYLTAELGDVVAVNAADGSIIWSQDIFRGHGVSPPVVIKDRVLIGDAKGRLHTLERDTGMLVETRKVASGSILGIVSDNKTVTVLSSEGNLIVLTL